MARKGKLLVALDAHKDRDYKLEKQKRQQKEAVKKKQTKSHGPDSEKANVKARPDATASMPETESDGWESDESEAADDISVCRASENLNIYLILTRP